MTRFPIADIHRRALLRTIGGVSAMLALARTGVAQSAPLKIATIGAGHIGGTLGSSAGSPFSFGITVKDTASGYSSPSQVFSIAVTGIVFGLVHFEELQFLGLAGFGIVLAYMARPARDVELAGIGR